MSRAITEGGSTTGTGTSGLGSFSPSGAGSVSGSGSTGTGSGSGSGSGTAMLPNVPAPSRRFANNQAVELTVGVFRETPDRVTRGPAFAIPAGSVVQLTPQTIDGAVNTGDVFFAVGPSSAARDGSNRTRVAPDSNPYTVRLRNLNELQVYSAVVGEGFSVQILSGG